MRLPTIMTIVLLGPSLLLTLPANARLKNPTFGAVTLNLPAEQETDSKHLHNQATGVYEYLGRLLGETFYRQLLESEEFLRIQELAIDFMEKHYRIAYPKSHVRKH